jgi:hypothetical protein
MRGFVQIPAGEFNGTKEDIKGLIENLVALNVTTKLNTNTVLCFQIIT